MKIKTKGREMKDATCEFISLVPRGANQIPFRIIKSDQRQENQPMGLDITNFLRTLKREDAAKAAATPTIVGVVAHKGEGLEALKAQLLEQGFEVENMVEKADSDLAVFLQGAGTTEADMEGAPLVALGAGDVMVALKGFSPWTDKLTTFSDRVQAQGFYMSVDGACDVLENTLFDIVYDADSQKDMAQKISDSCTEFQTYCLGLAKALPAAAFKMEKAIKAASHGKQGKTNTNADPKGQAMAANGSQDPNTHQHGAGGESAPATDDQVKPATAAKEETTIDAEAFAAAMKGEYKTVEELMTAMKAVVKTPPVVQVEDGPGEGDPNGTSSDKPTDFVSAVNKTGDLPTKVVDAPAKVAENPPMDEALKAQLTGFSDLLVAIKADLVSVKATQATQAEQIAQSISKSEGLETAIKGAVIGSATSTVEHPERTTTASTRKSSGAVLDTAFGGRAVFGGK